MSDEENVAVDPVPEELTKLRYLKHAVEQWAEARAAIKCPFPSQSDIVASAQAAVDVLSALEACQ